MQWLMTDIDRLTSRMPRDVFLLRVIAGKRCGGVLSLHAVRVPEDHR